MPTLRELLNRPFAVRGIIADFAFGAQQPLRHCNVRGDVLVLSHTSPLEARALVTILLNLFLQHLRSDGNLLDLPASPRLRFAERLLEDALELVGELLLGLTHLQIICLRNRAREALLLVLTLQHLPLQLRDVGFLQLQLPVVLHALRQLQVLSAHALDDLGEAGNLKRVVAELRHLGEKLLQLAPALLLRSEQLHIHLLLRLQRLGQLSDRVLQVVRVEYPLAHHALRHAVEVARNHERSAVLYSAKQIC